MGLGLHQMRVGVRGECVVRVGEGGGREGRGGG